MQLEKVVDCKNGNRFNLNKNRARIINDARPGRRVCLIVRSVHRLEVELSTFFDARWPARGDGLGAGVEFERVGAVLVQVPKD